jgi:GNAT superfamily N-acetyltransferase
MNSLRRLLKKIGNIFGFRLETYYVLHRTLDEEIKQFPLSEETCIKELTYEDFKDSEFFHLYPQNKKDLYKKRFSDQAYHAYGVSIDDELVYMTWIATDFLSIGKILIEKPLEQDEGVLVDSFVLPKARRHGIHMYMNGYRLKKLKEKGVRKVYAAVLAENTPALKTQIKHGFRQGEKITWLKWGKLQKYFKKSINFG